MKKKKKIKWNDDLVKEFARVYTHGSYGTYNGAKSVGDKLEIFKRKNNIKNEKEKEKKT
jgi:hypothetical protein